MKKHIAPHRKKARIISAGIIGNVIEYYDFAIIGFMAVIIGQLFFPSSDPFLSLLGSFGAFAAGMIMRPVGAIFFGHIGDKISRKYALFASLLMMALPTFLIGFLPTYAQAGIIAPILLVLLRMIQGFSVGGEYASSIVYLVESSPAGHQNLYGSFVSLGAKLGMAIGAGFCGLLIAHYGDSEMLDWAWRVPFWSSIILAILGLYLRRQLEDDYKVEKSKEIPIIEIVKHHRKEFWRYLILASAIWAFYYTLFIFLPVWLQEHANLSKTTTSSLNTYSIFLGVISIPIMAIISDHIGSIRLMKYASISTAVLIIPLFMVMASGDIVYSTIAITVMTLLLCAFQAPIFAATVNAISEHKYRASFTAVILGSAAGIVGGLTPAFMTTLIKITNTPIAPSVVIAILALVALSAISKTSNKVR